MPSSLSSAPSLFSSVKICGQDGSLAHFRETASYPQEHWSGGCFSLTSGTGSIYDCVMGHGRRRSFCRRSHAPLSRARGFTRAAEIFLFEPAFLTKRKQSGAMYRGTVLQVFSGGGRMFKNPVKNGLRLMRSNSRAIHRAYGASASRTCSAISAGQGAPGNTWGFMPALPAGTGRRPGARKPLLRGRTRRRLWRRLL